MRVFILESLEEDDQKTGEQIHAFLNSKSIESEFYRFTSKQELLSLLDAIKTKSASASFQPFVHLDCHGNEDGIGAINPSNGRSEMIYWEDIHQSFREVYTASGRKVIVCMSSCEGFNVVKLVAQRKPCPYDHVCGSFEEISFPDSLKGYKKFYDLVFSGKSIYESAVEVHNDPDLKDFKFIGLNSQTIFELGIEAFIRLECTPEKLEAKKLAHKNLIEGEQGYPLDKNQAEYIEKAFTVEGQKLFLEENRDIFFS